MTSNEELSPEFSALVTDDTGCMGYRHVIAHDGDTAASVTTAAFFTSAERDSWATS